MNGTETAAVPLSCANSESPVFSAATTIPTAMQHSVFRQGDPMIGVY
jgi:hypothetical protein